MRESRPAAETRLRPVRSMSGLWSTPTTRQPCCLTSSIATAAVPVATSRIVSSRRAGILDTRNRRQRGSWPKERRFAYRSYVGPRGANSSIASSRRSSDTATARVYGGPMDLLTELQRVAGLAAPRAASGEELTGILAAEPLVGGRVYLCAFGRDGETRSWLALDAGGEPITERERVREVVSLVALCEVAEE